MALALLLIDMQEHFRDMAEKIVTKLNSLAACCHANNIPVIYTQHGHHNPKEQEKTSVLVAWWTADSSIKYGSKAWQLLPELQLPPGAHSIQNKQTYDAFQGTDLKEFLDKHGVDTLIIGGVMTNLCCETTARSAFTKNYNVIFLSDGTATATEGMHKATLMNLKYGFAKVMTCKEAEKVVGGGSGAA